MNINGRYPKELTCGEASGTKNAAGKPCGQLAKLDGLCHVHHPKARDRFIQASLAGNRRPCTAHTKAGTPCRAFAMPGTDPGQCLQHSELPEHVLIRKERTRTQAIRSSKVGRAIVQLSRTDLGQNVYGRLMLAMEEVHEGTLPPARAAAMASIATAMVKVYQVAQLELEMRELQRQIARQGGTFGPVPGIGDRPVEATFLDEGGDVIDGEWTPADEEAS